MRFVAADFAGGDSAETEMQRFLLVLCRRDVADSALLAQCAELEQRGRRRAFLALAAALRVEGLVLVRLEKLPLRERLSEVAVLELLAPLASLRERAQRQERELERILGRCAEVSLTPTVLKGPALRRSVYGEAAERWCGDFDLLFPPQHFEQALDLLFDAGYRSPHSLPDLESYRRHHFHVLLRHPERFSLEIHWALHRPGSPFRLDAQAFVERAQVLQGDSGRCFRVPCREHLLLHTAKESREDAFSRLDRMVDLDRLIAAGELDWDYLWRQARAGGLDVVLALCLQMTQRLLGTRLPAGALVRPPRAARVHLALLRPVRSLFRRRFAERSVAAKLLRFWSIAGARARCTYLLEILTGREAELLWLWQGEAAARATPAAYGRGFVALAKLFFYQLWLYAAAGAALLRSSRRRELRFW